MAQKDNTKKLTLNELKKEDKKLNGQDEVSININGTDYKLSVDTVFRMTKKAQLLNDMVELFEEGRNRLELFDMATPYLSLLILKHFTSLDVPDDIDEALVMLRVLIDLDILGKLINILPEQEVTSVFELVTESVNNMRMNLEELEKEAERLSEQIENQELKEMLENGE
jgi:hypothetical protein